MVSFKKIWNDYGIGAILLLVVIAYGMVYFAGYLGTKGSAGMERNSSMGYQYKQSSGPQPSDPNGNEVYSKVGASSNIPGLPTSCTPPNNIQNPAELLPKDTNAQWAQLNPSGKGELANMNVLKAGYHIGIDTIGQSLRNGNLQVRSEPPNPQTNVGPWNQSTIEPDFMRPPLEIGSGAQ